jgi:hypothetical protein
MGRARPGGLPPRRRPTTGLQLPRAVAWSKERGPTTWSENARLGEYRLRERQFRGTSSASWLAETVTTGDAVRLANLEVPPSLETMCEPIVNAVQQSLERCDRLRDIGVVPGTLQIRERTLLTVTPCPDGPTLRQQMQREWPEGLGMRLAVAASLANIVACAHEH